MDEGEEQENEAKREGKESCSGRRRKDRGDGSLGTIEGLERWNESSRGEAVKMGKI